MKMNRRQKFAIRACAAAVAACFPFFTHAGGPMNVCSTGVPIKYPGTGTINLQFDQGILGSRTKANSDALVANAIGLWTNVGSSSVIVRQDPAHPYIYDPTLNPLTYAPVDVTAANFATFDNHFQDGLNPVVYDSDGSIIDSLYGTGANNSILGFAGSAYYDAPTCAYAEGQAVLNGKPVLTNSLGQTFTISDQTMTTTIAHEVGHLIGLDHTQLNSTQGGISSTSAYPLMYPIAYRTLLSLHEDDVAAITALYPDTTVNTSYGQLTGYFTSALGSGVRGANIFASGTGGNFSVVSDFLKQGTGYFRLYLPPGTYTLRAGAINSQFTGGSGVGPYSTSSSDVSFQPPLYNTSVSPSVPMAIVTHPQTITITAGCVATATFTTTGTGSIGGNCGSAATPPPSAPTGVSPSGSISTLNPTYVWNAVTGAVTYEFLVQNLNGVLVDTTYTAAAANCGAGTGQCSVTPGTSLVDGTNYGWYVRAINASGTSAWSTGLSFTGSMGTPPNQPVTIAPNGTITTTTPAYSWNAISNATSYNLLVQNLNGVAINNFYTPAQAGCGSGTGTCTVTPAAPLAVGVMYGWYVSASNNLGTSAWSAGRNITVSGTTPTPTPSPTPTPTPTPTNVPPSPPTLASPTGGTTVTTSMPTYSWSARSGATTYQLLVQNLNGVGVNMAVTPAQAGCTAGTGNCTFTPSVALANANWGWFVNATNAYGTSAWSNSAQFTVSTPTPTPSPTPAPTPSPTPSPTPAPNTPPTAPTIVSPSGGMATSASPAYSWTARSNATTYQLLVQNLNGVGVNMAVTPAQANCSGGTGNCTFTPSVALAVANWGWFVNAGNAYGTSAWSNSAQFTVSGTTPTPSPTPSPTPTPTPTPSGIPVVPMLVSPTGGVTVTTASPTFTWNASLGTTSYQLLVQNLNGVGVNMAVSPAAAGCGAGTGMCSIVPNAGLSNANWGWFVNATNAMGTSAWSNSAQFTVNAGATPTPTPTPTPSNSPPAVPTLVSPAGGMVTATRSPTFTWNASAGATSYWLLVQNLNGVGVNMSLTAAQANCSTGTGQCTFAPSVVLATANWGWFVNATNAYGTSAWSNSAQFTTP
jgi:hypothetical protein